MEKYEISYANAEYTGGGIYVFYGQLVGGKYFLASDYETAMYITDTDPVPVWDDVWYMEWLDANCEEVEMTEEFWNSMTRWIVEHRPEGNYCAAEIDGREFG